MTESNNMFVKKEEIDEDKLISEVEIRPELWDKDSERYKKKDVKMNSWAEVSLVLRARPSDCTSLWTAIRDNYVRKSLNPPSGSSAAMRRFLVQQTKLSFLEKSIEHRVAASNVKEKSGIDAHKKHAPDERGPTRATNFLQELEENYEMTPGEVSLLHSGDSGGELEKRDSEAIQDFVPARKSSLEEPVEKRKKKRKVSLDAEQEEVLNVMRSAGTALQNLTNAPKECKSESVDEHFGQMIKSQVIDLLSQANKMQKVKIKCSIMEFLGNLEQEL